MQLLFWVSLFGASYSYVIYPLVLLLLPKKKCQKVNKLISYPTISLIITAHNEESRIKEKLENTLAISYPADLREIIVASDSSTDATDETVRHYKHKGVRLVRSKERYGKEHAQLLATKESKGEILIFTDVGTRIPPDAVSSMIIRFEDQKVGAVSSADRFISRDGAITGEGLYVRYEMWLRALESSTNSLIGLSGSFFAVRRDVCKAWDVNSPSDFTTALNCYRLGYVAVSDPEVVAYYQDVQDELKEYGRKVRTVIRGMAAVFRQPTVLNPFTFRLFAFQMWSHKIFRWLVPWFLLLLLFSSLVIARGHVFYLLATIAQLCLYLSALIAALSKSLRKLPIFKIPFYFVQANLATLHATMAFLFGRRVTVWEPSER